MKNRSALLIGIGILLVIVLVSLIVGDTKIIVHYAGVLGLITIGLSAVLTGVFAESRRLRTEYREEQGREDRRHRIRLATLFLLIGLPNMLVAVLMLYVQK
ncbi:DUF5316 domain-containing protein [Paenibacillus sp. N1-5-1-14]|uniref:DUF5316 domain-containing protein n=1 Tax=Paenibacillus radicibacter TaxID=2972488 RepID=UPI002158F816|nr:DUF5316 domain-containing protein [Paenibacillus radicibacter]MCR8644423.1 DUF5316 domain-containing protein [Paenibacillus radicibacter]